MQIVVGSWFICTLSSGLQSFSPASLWIDLERLRLMCLCIYELLILLLSLLLLLLLLLLLFNVMEIVIWIFTSYDLITFESLWYDLRGWLGVKNHLSLYLLLWQKVSLLQNPRASVTLTLIKFSDEHFLVTKLEWREQKRALDIFLANLKGQIGEIRRRTL